MAQWKRAGPITQRSEVQNLALLIILFVILFFFHDCYKAVKCYTVNDLFFVGSFSYFFLSIFVVSMTENQTFDFQ